MHIHLTAISGIRGIETSCRACKDVPYKGLLHKMVVIPLGPTPNVSWACLDEYLREENRIEKEIWSVIDVRGKTVIDVGVGESTRKLKELGATVIAVGSNPEKLKRW